MINPVDLFQHNKRFRLDKISQQEHAKTDRKSEFNCSLYFKINDILLKKTRLTFNDKKI